MRIVFPVEEIVKNCGKMEFLPGYDSCFTSEYDQKINSYIVDVLKKKMNKDEIMITNGRIQLNPTIRKYNEATKIWELVEKIDGVLFECDNVS